VEYSVGSHIVVESDLQCPDVVSLIDPSQLENALLNLSLNSASAMPDGGRLAFSTKLCTLPDSDVPAIRIRVEDSGEGIDDEVIGRIFEPFFTTKPVGKGSGLGLSMIYGFVKQSGGEIKVTSEKGKWTRVCLFLPQQITSIDLLAEDKRVFEEKASKQDIILLPEFSLVWLVEDDEEVCRVMREQLEKMGFMVQTFDCAEAVMNALSKAIVPDAIVSDVNLAGTMSGVELAHSLNSDSFGFTGPILLMSGLPRDELKQKYQLKDEDLFISKPFTIKELSGIFQIEY
ncbi:MAG: response regulator, partial [Gammaproteobacteria bacterium]|nr:response regulator [Gammaproteobacteria bacterium]